MTYEDVEPLRAGYRPAKIKVLFVGESAPAGGDFFYKQTGQAHGQFRQVLARHIGDSPSFVEAFKQSGFYLDDLVLEPVNWLSRSERKAIHAANIASLAKRLRDLRLKFQVQHPEPAGHRMLRWTDDASTSEPRNVA